METKRLEIYFAGMVLWILFLLISVKIKALTKFLPTDYGIFLLGVAVTSLFWFIAVPLIFVSIFFHILSSILWRIKK